MVDDIEESDFMRRFPDLFSHSLPVFKSIAVYACYVDDGDLIKRF